MPQPDRPQARRRRDAHSRRTPTVGWRRLRASVGGLDARQRWRVAFASQPLVFFGSEHLGGGALEVDPVAAYEARGAGRQNGDAAVNAEKLTIRVAGQKDAAVDDWSQQERGEPREN